MKHRLDILKLFIEAPGPSGNEYLAQCEFLDETEHSGFKQYHDEIGNYFTEIPGDPGMPRIMFTAHADTIGFMVKYIDDQGFIFTEDIGGTDAADPKMLPGTKVNIMSRHNNALVPGQFIPVIPYHLVTDEFDEDMTMTRYEMAIDIGATTFEDAQEQVDIGDYVVFRPQYELLGERISATFLDDRLGMYMLYLIGKWCSKLKGKKRPTVILASTVGEEGMLGAVGVTVNSAKPDISITLDVMPATDMIIHDADFEVFKKHGKCKLEDGPVVARGLGVSDTVFRALEKLCIDKKLEYQIELAKLDTDNQFIHNKGVKTGLIMIPVRNAHTCVETCSVKDIDLTFKLCQYFINNCKLEELR
jgi:putative aminopeptidase FrvX